MSQNSTRQIRVFISSTFRDMQAERDHLVKFIFPQLRKLCEQRNVTWSEVDLRWGITDEQSTEEQVLPICLQEIQNCRPYFIGILGERYGWVPEKISLELIEREPWLVEQLEHSVTELEILHGVLNNPDMAGRALFYFRDPAFLTQLSTEEQRDFVEHPRKDEIAQYGLEGAKKRVQGRRRKLAALKQRIRTSGLPLRENFQDAQQLGTWVLEDLRTIIDLEYPEGSQPDPLQWENQEHETFAANRAKVYIGGEQYFSAIDAHISRSSTPLVIVGESGAGKSALLANWGRRYRREHPNDLVIMHFIGATSSSSDWAAMLRRILDEIKQQFDLQDDIPEDSDQLRSVFPEWLHRVSQRGSLVLILDALNQLVDRQGAQELTWLPLELPKNIHLILSTLPGKALQTIKQREYKTLPVFPLTISEREQLVFVFLEQYAKQLNREQVKRIVQDPQCGNPLALRILLDELRQFGIYERLDEIIDHYLHAKSIPEMIEKVLIRCEADYEAARPSLVRDAMRFIWAARDGISETELLDLLGKENKPLPQRLWAPLHLAIESSLFERGGLLNFFHDHMRQAVEQRYLPTDHDKNEAHLALAIYFDVMHGTSPRKAVELPWQLQQAKEWEKLYTLLRDREFLEVLWLDHPNDLYAYWASVEENSSFNKVQAYKDIANKSDNLDLELLNGLSILFQKTGYVREAIEIYKKSEEISRQSDYMDILTASLGNQAIALKSLGKLEEAMVLHKEKERICRQMEDLQGLGQSLGNQALILATWGKLEQAMDLHREQERIFRQVGDMDGIRGSLGNQATILYRWGKLKESLALLKEEERICRQLGNLENLPGSLGNQALIMKNWGKLEEAYELHQEEEQIYRHLGNIKGVKASLNNQALILKTWGRLEEAMVLHKEGERISRRLGNLDGLAISLTNQAIIQMTWGELDKAMELLKEAEGICQQLGDRDGLESTLINQALILQTWGKLDEAMLLQRECEHICRELHNQEGLSIALGNQALIHSRLGNLEEALRLHEEEEKICIQIGDLEGQEAALENRACVLQKMGNLEESMRLHKESEKICRQLNDIDSLQLTLGNQALILHSQGKLEEALVLHLEKEDICRKLGNLDSLQIVLNNQAAILFEKGDLEKALQLLKENEKICRKLNNLDSLVDSLGNQVIVLKALGKVEEARQLQEEQARISSQSRS